MLWNWYRGGRRGRRRGGASAPPLPGVLTGVAHWGLGSQSAGLSVSRSLDGVGAAGFSVPSAGLESTQDVTLAGAATFGASIADGQLDVSRAMAGFSAFGVGTPAANAAIARPLAGTAAAGLGVPAAPLDVIAPGEAVALEGTGSVGFAGVGTFDELVDWTPAALPYLYSGATYLWHNHDAVNLTLRTDGANQYISRRADSGNANLPAAQATEANQPLYVASEYNGYACARYDGADDSLICAAGDLGDTDFDVDGTDEWTIILMQAVPLVQGSGAAFTFSTRNWDDSNHGDPSGTMGNEVQLALRWTQNSTASRSPGVYVHNSVMNTGASQQDGAANINVARWNGSALKFTINGGADQGLNVGTSTSVTPEIIFGALEDLRRNAICDDVEAVILDRALSDADVERMEGYLAHKYARTAALPGAHPYKTDAPQIWASELS